MNVWLHPDEAAALLDALDPAAANSPQQFGTYMRDEIARWARFFKEAGLKLEQVR